VRQLIHELRVHQIELEMQNEELRRTQVGLDSARARYFDLYDFAPVGYCTISENGLILESNLTAATLLGMVRSELVKQPFSRLILREDQDIFYLSRKQLLGTGEPQTCELRMVKRDGTTFWALLQAIGVENEQVGSGQATDGARVLRVVLSDITERKLAEEARRESEARTRTLSEASFEGIAISARGRLVDVNDQLARMLGYEKFEMIGREITDFVSPLSSATVDDHVRAETQACYENDALRKDGSVLHVESRARMLLQQGVSTRITIIRNITERKRHEAEKGRLEGLNRQLQKNESLGRMAAAIAHHFNNHLQVAKANLELALGEMHDSEEVRSILTDANSAVLRASEVSRSMQTYLGYSRVEQEPVDLSEFCRRSLPLLQTAMPNHVVLQSEFPAIGPVIRASANQMEQLLTNLLTNAWEATGPGQNTIRVTVKTVAPTDMPISHRFPIDWQTRNTDHACLEVADTGSGVATKDIENLFDPFFSNKFTGRGMGLAMVLGIARAHDGGITVESEPDKGSVFRVYFPLTTEQVHRQPDRVVEVADLPSGGVTLLVVDDEEMVRKSAVKMLMWQGFSVLAAKDGVEAVEIFRQHADEIRCVLCDLTMPRMDGWETLTALRQLAPGLPVILASGYSEAHVMAGDHPERPQAFLNKPYGLQQLQQAIRQALASKQN
jgi:PAS domain S-box-containing protein